MQQQQTRDLVSVLHAEHVHLLARLDRVRVLGEAGSREALELLCSAEELLMAHFALEDSLFYPVLWRAAESDRDLALTLNQFAISTQGITQQAKEFFRTYRAGADGLEYARAFGTLIATLRGRINCEEAILSPIYRDLMKKRST